jgi:hypothetical protein
MGLAGFGANACCTHHEILKIHWNARNIRVLRCREFAGALNRSGRRRELVGIGVIKPRIFLEPSNRIEARD